MRGRSTRFVVTLAAAALLVAACGDDSDSTEESPEASPPDTTAAAPASTAATGTGDTDAGPETTGASSAPGTSTGSDADWDAVVAAASEEGAVVLYSGSDETTNANVETAFEAAYPEIDAEIIRLNSSEIVPRVDAERETGAAGADVLSNTLTTWLGDLTADDDLAPMVGPDFAAVQETLFAERPALANDSNFATYLGGAWEIVWNTDLVDTPITGYADLVARQDEFAGQVGMPDLYGDVVVEFYRSIQLGADGDDGDPADSAILNGLADLQPRFFDSVVPLTNAVAAGELKAGIYSARPVWQGLAAQGAPIEGTIDPDVPASANVYLAATSFGEHPNAAQVFTNFMFTPAGQEAAAGLGYLSVLPDTPGAAGGPETMADPLEEMQEPGFTDSFREAWESIFRG